MSWLTRLAKIVGLAALAIALLPLILARLGGWKALSVQTGSMRPAINPGDVVFVKSVPKSHLAVGDVVTYINPANKQQTITHRITAIQGEKFTLKGDANKTADPVVFSHYILGKQAYRLPLAGHYMDFVYSWPGLILLIYLPALGVILGEVRRLTTYYKTREPYVLPEVLARRREPKKRLLGRHGGVASVVLFLVFATLAPIVQAVLDARVSLTANTISTLPMSSVESEGVMLRYALIACAVAGSNTASVRLVLFNRARQPAPVGDWYVQSEDQRILTVPTGTLLPYRQPFETATTVEGLTARGGPVKLYTSTNQEVDTARWHREGDASCLRARDL
jgi:signal peptidase